MLERLGIPVEFSFHEDSPSQHEIDLQYSEALSMADNVMMLRLVVRKVAMENGVYATFMPKPLNGVQGSGMHTHMSLFEGESNAFHDPSDEYGLSKVGRCFIAGLLRHAREITAVTNQLVNSYKRLNEGYEAPQYVSWARNNRSALVRVPTPKRGKAESTRIEYRAIDPACNPYLVFSLLLAAGMKGIQENYELPARRTATCSSSLRRINWRSASNRCHNRCQKRSTRWIDPRSFARRSVDTSTNGSSATSDPNGVTINESSRSSNWTAICRCGER